MSSSPDVARMKRDLASLVAIDTQNPSGREADAARFLGGLEIRLGKEIASG